MQFTKAEEYGLCGMVHLAKQPRGAVVSLGIISREQRIPDKFLAKIFQSLTRAGILRSHRGVHGGFSLARPPRQISVGEILAAIQSSRRLLKPARGRRTSATGSIAVVRDVILEGRRHMFTYYDRCSLKELADRC